MYIDGKLMTDGDCQSSGWMGGYHQLDCKIPRDIETVAVYGQDIWGSFAGLVGSGGGIVTKGSAWKCAKAFTSDDW